MIGYAAKDVAQNRPSVDLADKITTMRSFDCSECFLCGTAGTDVYVKVYDRIAYAPGAWNYKECRGCSLLWLDPMPCPEDIANAYRDYFTHDEVTETPRNGVVRQLYRMAAVGYLTQRFGYPAGSSSLCSRMLGRMLRLMPTRTNYLDFSVMHVSYKAEGKLLDVGCGTGRALRVLRDLGWEVEGIDFDPVAANIARSKGLNVHFGTVEKQSYSEDSFDAIVLSHVIEHVHKPVEFLTECNRILKPGGQLVMLTPNIESWGRRHFQDRWLLLDPPRHLHLFSERSLSEVAYRAGLRPIKAVTLARTAGRMFAGSLDIIKTGRHNASKHLSQASRIGAEVIEFGEWLFSKWDRLAGEELMVIASK
jgi:2-polyprenyl-3-methyl-5-hydroxy-6-metoxy-1,4-benzoquinol methylase